MSKRGKEFSAGAPRKAAPQPSGKWRVRQKVLHSDNYRDWHPPLPISYPSVGRGQAGESSN